MVAGGVVREAGVRVEGTYDRPALEMRGREYHPVLQVLEANKVMDKARDKVAGPKHRLPT